MLDSVNSDCHILLSQAISWPLLPLHSLGNICIVYGEQRLYWVRYVKTGCCAAQLPLTRNDGGNKQKLKSEGTLTPPHHHPELTSIVSVSRVILCFGQASWTVIRSTQVSARHVWGCPLLCVAHFLVASSVCRVGLRRSGCPRRK